MMYAVEEDGRIIADPSWASVADVVGTYHGGFAVDGRVSGTLLCRESEDDDWAEMCHCGQPVAFGFDGDPTHHRGMCVHCDSVRCDVEPGTCAPDLARLARKAKPIRIDGMVGIFKPAESTIAAEAHAAVYGQRGEAYGHPRDNFTDTARLWTALLAHKLQPGEQISPEDIARCMIGIKLARDLNSPKRDNRVDIIGYAITLDRLETGD